MSNELLSLFDDVENNSSFCEVPKQVEQVTELFESVIDTASEPYPKGKIRYKLKIPEKSKPYWTITIFDQTCFKVQGVKKQYFEMSLANALRLERDGITIERRRGNRARIPIDTDLSRCKRSFYDIFEAYYASDHFDCCSRYEECSAARHCVQKDFEFAVQCTYRQKLKGGIVFFGKNRNI